MRIELTRRGDYAVRAALVLARQDRMMSGPSIAAEAGIPASFVPQVMGDLVHSGLAKNRLGRGGGYALAQRPRDIPLLAIIEAVEGDPRRRACVMRNHDCGREGYCDVHEAFAAAQEALLSSLAGVSLADVQRPRSG
ncbi:MAG: RrF2 family transcriptional regulator [Candidatus Limnocylindria bacterium]